MIMGFGHYGVLGLSRGLGWIWYGEVGFFLVFCAVVWYLMVMFVFVCSAGFTV